MTMMAPVFHGRSLVLSLRLLVIMALSVLLIRRSRRPAFGLATVNAFRLTTSTPTTPTTTRQRQRNFHVSRLARHRDDRLRNQYNRNLLGSAAAGATRPAFIVHRHFLSPVEGDGSNEQKEGEPPPPSSMSFVHQEWTLEQDELLWKNRKACTIEELSSLLGRGLGGIEARLAKFKDVNSAAYQRLFADNRKNSKKRRSSDADDMGDDYSQQNKNHKLVPASEVLRRIQWDYQLDPKDFSILHYDRVDDTVVETALDAPNDSISGNDARFVDALPEHRIVGIKYRERMVWDREQRMDQVFSNEGIETVIKTYDQWKANKDAANEANRARQREVTDKMRMILGVDRFAQLKELSSSLQLDAKDGTVSIKKQVEAYVERALDLFRQVRSDPTSSLEPMLIPMSDYHALDAISEVVALLPDAELRPVILVEINMAMDQALGKKNTGSQQQPPDQPIFDKAAQRRPLPQFREEDVSEKFVRGSGAGGQKINKTANRVVLVHEPTKIRIECQDTRSLQQNRKIARKRLRQKLDEYYHGSQSKASLAAQKASSKKKKARARSRARQRKKKEKAAASATDSVDSSDKDLEIY